MLLMLLLLLLWGGHGERCGECAHRVVLHSWRCVLSALVDCSNK